MRARGRSNTCAAAPCLHPRAVTVRRGRLFLAPQCPFQGFFFFFCTISVQVDHSSVSPSPPLWDCDPLSASLQSPNTPALFSPTMFPWHFHKRVAEDLASWSLLLTISSHPKGKKAFWENPWQRDRCCGTARKQSAAVSDTHSPCPMIWRESISGQLRRAPPFQHRYCYIS